MTFLDNAKKQLRKAVNDHGHTIEKGADRLGHAINERTGNKHADKVAKGREQLKKGLRSLDDSPHDRPDDGPDDKPAGS